MDSSVYTKKTGQNGSQDLHEKAKQPLLAGCAVLFALNEKKLYPESQSFKVQVPDTLQGDALVVLGAAKIGATRLIDNLEV